MGLMKFWLNLINYKIGITILEKQKAPNNLGLFCMICSCYCLAVAVADGGSVSNISTSKIMLVFGGIAFP
jgi:hypothetical protein